MLRTTFYSAAIGVAGLCAAYGASGKAAISLEGDRLEGEIGKITKEGKIGIAGALEPLDTFREIVSPQQTTASISSSASKELILVNGSRLKCLGIRLLDEYFLLNTEKLGELKIPIDIVRAARFRFGFPEARFNTATGRPLDELEDDRFFLVQEKGEVLETAGFVEEIDETRILFERADNGKLEDVIPDRLHGIVFVTPWRNKEGQPPYSVTLMDNTRLAAGEIWRSSDGPLQLTIEGGVELSVPWDSVRRIGIRSPRLLYVSDVAPKFTKDATILSLERPWQKDRSVTAGQLNIGGTPYEKGIGMSSGTRLDFDCSDYDRFVAVAGIDSSARGRGDCEYVVRLDGEERWRQRIVGGQAPVPVRLDLGGAKTLSLIVEPGADLDLGDFANWSDASLIQIK